MITYITHTSTENAIIRFKIKTNNIGSLFQCLNLDNLAKKLFKLQSGHVRFYFPQINV